MNDWLAKNADALAEATGIDRNAFELSPDEIGTLLHQYGSLEGALAAGRFAAEAEDLRLFRRIAQMDASAPLPPLERQTPTWAEASSFVSTLGLRQSADRLASFA